jgi:hypothetical protein
MHTDFPPGREVRQKDLGEEVSGTALGLIRL